MEKRICSGCFKSLPLTLDYYSLRIDDGVIRFRHQCKDCIKSKTKKRELRNPRPKKKCPVCSGLMSRNSTRMCRSCWKNKRGPKICSKCKNIYPRTEEYFTKRSGTIYFSSWCKKCIREYARKRQQRRRNDPKEKEKLLCEKRKYRYSPKGLLAKRRRSLIYNNKRRQRKLKSPYVWTMKDWKRCLRIWNNQCVYCGETTKLTQDHFIPISHSSYPGTSLTNMVPACLKCNLKKGSQHPFDWLEGNQIYFNIVSKLASLEIKIGDPDA